MLTSNLFLLFLVVIAIKSIRSQPQISFYEKFQKHFHLALKMINIARTQSQFLLESDYFLTKRIYYLPALHGYRCRSSHNRIYTKFFFRLSYKCTHSGSATTYESPSNFSSSVVRLMTTSSVRPLSFVQSSCSSCRRSSRPVVIKVCYSARFPTR